MPLELILLALFAAAAWLWMESLKVREAAVAAAREACAVEGLLLLDDTVAIAGIKLARAESGRIQFQRTYDFEFSDTGNNRCTGSVVLLGREVVVFNVGTREPPVVRSLR